MLCPIPHRKTPGRGQMLQHHCPPSALHQPMVQGLATAPSQAPKGCPLQLLLPHMARMRSVPEPVTRGLSCLFLPVEPISGAGEKRRTPDQLPGGLSWWLHPQP